MIKLAKISHIDNATVTLRLQENNQCLDCESHCNDGFLSFLFHKSKTRELKVARNNIGTGFHLMDGNNFFDQSCQVNDVIGINFDESKLLRLTTILYGLPIILIFFLLIMGSFTFDALGLNVDVGGCVGFLTGLILAKYLISTNQEKMKPHVKFFK